MWQVRVQHEGCEQYWFTVMSNIYIYTGAEGRPRMLIGYSLNDGLL